MKIQLVPTFFTSFHPKHCLSDIHCPASMSPALGTAANQSPAGQNMLLKGRKVLEKLQLNVLGKCI